MNRVLPVLSLCCLTALATVTGACAGEDKGKPVTYQLTARQNYEKGLRELKDQNYLEAIKYFSFVKTRFPFSRYATLAELRIADAQLGRGHQVEAIDAYRQFIKFHPTHDMVANGYASYKICEAYFEQMPDDWFLTPPAYEKDQTATREALKEFDGFLAKHADSRFAAEARKRRKECVKRLIDTELYVARFYLGRSKPKAAALRLRGILEQYPGAAGEPDIMLMLGRTYLQMEQVDRARETFERLTVEHPRDYNARRAKLYLEYIDRRFGPPGSEQAHRS